MQISSLEALKTIIKPTHKSYVEVGVSRAKNLVAVANTFDNLDILYGIDPYKPYIDRMVGLSEVGEKLIITIKNEALININNCKNKHKIKLIIDTSENIVNQFEDNSLDVVFIDTVVDEEEYKNQIVTWFKKVKRKGVLCGHDWHIKKVKDITLELLKNLGEDHRHRGYTNKWQESNGIIWYITKL